MQLALFWIFSLLMLIFGAAVIFLRSPVSSALSLVVSLVFMAALFVTLDAFFIGVVQVLVYAGAVMVLFLFVIMLLDIKAEERRKIQRFSVAAGAIAVAAITGIFVKSLFAAKPGANLPAPAADGATIPLGKLLFTQYLLPFEIVSILLLVAMVGVILLSKKDLK
jgi:NADH-quinone oxidoreductase subunit J